MDLIYLYLIFAAATSLTSLYELVHPVLLELAIFNKDDLMIEHTYLTYFVFLLSGIALAPALLLPCVVPSLGVKFRLSLLNVLKGQKI